MIRLFLFAACAVALFQSCSLGTSGSFKDENIEPGLKNEIQNLDEQVLQAVTTNRPKLLEEIMSDELLEVMGAGAGELVQQAGNVIRTSDYRILNQFYVTNSTIGIGNTVMSGVSGLNDYVIQYQALNEEMFISIIVPTGVIDEFAITNVYGKYPDGWKLNILQFGKYKVNELTAPELYMKAEKQLDDGYLVDAANNMFLCSQVASPANKFWQYQKEDEMKSFQEKVMASVSTEYTFPIVMDEIESKPQILSIYPFGMQEGYFPMIEYLTTVDLKDTVNLKSENDRMQRMIGQTFNGIDKDKELLFYKAYNQVPDGKSTVSTYVIIQELK